MLGIPQEVNRFLGSGKGQHKGITGGASLACSGGPKRTSGSVVGGHRGKGQRGRLERRPKAS